MNEQDQRNRRWRQQGLHSSGDQDRYGSSQQPQQWSDERYGHGQQGAPWEDSGAPRAPGGWYASAGAGDTGDYRSREERGNQRRSEDDLARSAAYHPNAYGASTPGFEERYAQVGNGSGFNAGWGPNNPTAGNSSYAYGGPGYAGGTAPGAGGSYSSARGGGHGGYGGDHERGFFERAGDEIASWFGDEEAARRREEDHRGRGPSGYVRSDERIREDACDRLTDDWAVDARNVTVSVESGEVTLDGTVDSRRAKRRAEDCIEGISGVRHVQNNLRVQETSSSTSARSQNEV